jgi:hypothetical protein
MDDNMGTRMDLPIEIDDELFAEATSEAARRGTTLSALVAEGLRYVVGQINQGKDPKGEGNK